MPTPPIYQKINLSEAPALFLAVTSDAFPAERLYDIAQQTIVPEISRQPGVGGALLQGAERSAACAFAPTVARCARWAWSSRMSAGTAGGDPQRAERVSPQRDRQLVHRCQ